MLLQEACYWQWGRALARGGSGLGRSIAKRVATVHAARVQVEHSGALGVLAVQADFEA